MPADVTLEDISAVIRLVREVCDRWDDPAAWRRHLLGGACALLGGNVGTMVAEHAGRDRRFGKLAVVATVGLPPAMRPRAQPAISRWDRRDYDDVSKHLMPGITALHGEVERQGWATVSRAQITDAASDHAGSHYLDYRRAADCDDYVVSVRIVDLPRRPEAMSVDRPHGAPPFGPREVALLKLLHDEIAPLVGVRLATEAHVSRDGLSKRLRETLSLLLDGCSEKEAAAALGLAPGTVHDYVTTLYEHFRVSSRGELLAYFIRREPELREAGALLPRTGAALGVPTGDARRKRGGY